MTFGKGIFRAKSGFPIRMNQPFREEKMSRQSKNPGNSAVKSPKFSSVSTSFEVIGIHIARRRLPQEHFLRGRKPAARLSNRAAADEATKPVTPFLLQESRSKTMFRFEAVRDHGLWCMQSSSEQHFRMRILCVCSHAGLVERPFPEHSSQPCEEPDET